MNKHLKQIEKSYDKAVEYGKKGIDLYQALPASITTDSDYAAYQSAAAAGALSDSGRQEIRQYLAPTATLKFIDLGCCLNLMFRGYDQWPATYYGVDISSKTIQLLQQYADTKALAVGALHCGNIVETPFADNAFDIGACIGVLEYFESSFIIQALAEIQRIMKSESRFVLDVPNSDSPTGRIAALIEAHLQRPNLYDLTPDQFEALLQEAFIIEKMEKVGPMLQYFLRVKKKTGPC